MKVIYNNIIPFKGFAAINLLGTLFARKGIKINDTILNHESIHTEQMKELIFILFYILYLLEWLIKLPFYKFNSKEAYKNISFEREAFMNQNNLDYLNTRKHYNWINKIFK